MATMHQLVDITKCSWGGTAIARATDVGVQIEDQRVQHNAGTLIGPSAIDTVQRGVRATVSAEDPLVLPTLLGVAGLIGTLVAGGRVVNSTTYEDLTLLRCLLVGFGLRITDQQPGSLSLSLQNRATEGSELSDELSIATGSKQAFSTRRNTIRIRAEAEFVDDASAELSLPGIESVSVDAAPQSLLVACTNPASGSNHNLCDVVDAMDWLFTGSLTLRDQTIASALTTAERLSNLNRGTFTMPCQVSKFADGAAPDPDKILTFERIKFHSPRRTYRTKGFAAVEVPFDQMLLAVDGSTEKTLAQMIAITEPA